MTTTDPGTTTPGDRRRREAVLLAALEEFARRGYRRTSMDDVAAAADISRPGLYFLFASKPRLFAEAVHLGVARDLGAAAEALRGVGPLDERLLDAFDAWTGRYVGAGGAELSALVAAHPELVDEAVRTAPTRFRDLVRDALAVERPDADDVTGVLVALAVGLKQQVATRAEFRAGFATALGLLLR